LPWKELLAALAAYAFVIEPARLVVRRVDVPITDLPPELNGLKIGQISDLHRGPMMPRRRVERAVALMAAESPDLVALTGDFVSYRSGYATEYPEILAPLRPQLGSFACIGNHDHWADPDGITEALQAAGATVLRNQNQVVTVDRRQLCMIGIDDIGRSGLSAHSAEAADDLPAALAGSPPSDVIRILLVHNPDFVMGPAFARAMVHSPTHLVLSGHTHGGQVRLPLIGAVRLPSRYKHMFGGGLVQVAGTQVHVSRGAGSSLPIRFNCPPEVNVLTLRSA
jgi:hypothetical protein